VHDLPYELTFGRGDYLRGSRRQPQASGATGHDGDLAFQRE
jgi:hypothetical protein